MNNSIVKLKELAKKVSLKAYAPYSQFKVGAAFQTDSGDIFTGCNVENLAFPSGICAERTAIFKGISEMGPSMKINTLVVYTATKKFTTPCGACRQVMNEFALPDTRIICVCDTDTFLDMPFSDLLPKPTEIDGL